MKKLLRPDELQDRLNISRATVYRLIAAGHFECLKVGGSLRILSTSVDSYIKRQMDIFALENF